MKKAAAQFGANLNKIRRATGISQEELAKIVGVDKSYISNLEHGRNNPTLATLEKLANALRIPIADLVR